jgi:hypothetical protein
MDPTEQKVYAACRILLSGVRLPDKNSGQRNATYTTAVYNACCRSEPRLVIVLQLAFGQGNWDTAQKRQGEEMINRWVHYIW